MNYLEIFYLIKLFCYWTSQLKSFEITFRLDQIGIFNKLLLFSDGKEVSDYFETLLDGFIDGNSEG